MSQEYGCRPGCLDYKEYGVEACEECINCWKEYLRPLEPTTKKVEK